jgi:tetratricopeptide (TPR) repeat protein
MSELIGPDGLEPDTVVPQCLDNQYVSDRVFNEMINRGADYQDQRVTEARERDFRTEFIRSLVYSSQVVIQRAHLKNSEFLYKNYQPQNIADLRAFATLMRNHAIIPYLYAESSLTDKLDFHVRDEGDSAVRALLGEVGDDVCCVRLAVDDTANAQAADIMATDFGAGITRLNHLDSSQRNAMAVELFDKERREQLEQQGRWEEFEQAVDNLASYAFSKAGALRRENKKLTRQSVYQDRFAAGDNDRERARNVALGRFKEPDAVDPFILELKKYVDLVYNVNLPDHLRRYTFTPVNMPSRMALQDAPREGFRHEQIRSLATNPEALEWIRRSFMARAQSAMTLPLLSELSMADVVAIRDLPEWESFKDAQQQILRDPLRCLENMEAFQESFDHFQQALSDWYNRSYERDRTVQRYCGFVTLALSIGGVLAVAGSHLGSIPHDLAGIAAPEVARKIPQRVKGYAAKLMVGVYDIGKKRLDADRSYTIELMQTSEELMREEVIELLRSVNRAENALPNATGLVADQGIQ